MEFLYPTSKQYPFDDVCGEIVRALEARNFDVPGLQIKLDTYGSGEQRMRYVSLIEGADFRLWFCRSQRTLSGGRWNDIAAVCDIAIPQKQLSVYEDNGVTLCVYVGDDWEGDRAVFMRGHGVNSKLRGERRTYLRFKGRCECQRSGGPEWLRNLPHTHEKQRPPLLVVDNDLGREYDAEGDEPTRFETAAILTEFRDYLLGRVLFDIMLRPIAAVKIDPLAEPEAIPFPDFIGPIYCFAEDGDVRRVLQGQLDPSQLDAAKRYGMSGGGRRLSSYDVRNDGTVPEIAYDGFLWCGLGEVDDNQPTDGLQVPGHYRWTDRERFVLRVKPKTANGIYIADHAPYDVRRKELAELDAAEALRRGESPPSQYTREQINDFNNARARTIVPIHEYEGGFDQPVVLVNRELGFDEVEIVGKHELAFAGINPSKPYAY